MPQRSPKKLIERIGELYHAGYLDRPRAQLDYFDRAGSAPMVYAPGDRSNEVAPENAGIKWHDKNRLARRPYIEHALAIADIMIALELSARDRRDLEMLHQHDLKGLQDSRRGTSRFSMSAIFHVNGSRHQFTIVPDAVFALRFKSSGRTAYFFLEVDRGTMAIDSRDLTKSSYRRKLLGYLTALKAGQHVERFAFQNARMLTVTTSRERIQSMIAALNAITRQTATGRFLFADLPSLLRSDPLSYSWLTNGASISGKALACHRLDLGAGAARGERARNLKFSRR